MIFNTLLETPRLTLRNLRVEDIGEKYIAWLSDPEIVQFLEVRFQGPQTVEATRAFVVGINSSAHSVLFGIFSKDSGRHIGNIKLGPVVKEHSRADLGYLIGERAEWGKGYASEAIARVARFGIEYLGISKIKAGCYENNVGSAKALLKAGFRHEATIPLDSVCDGRRVGSLIFALNA